MSDPLYVLYPGMVVSRTDGDVHYVGQAALIALYCIPPTARVALADRLPLRQWPDDAIHCWPRFDGDYPAFEEADRE